MPANWIQLPGPMWVNLDRLEEIRLTQIEHGHTGYRVDGQGGGSIIHLAGPFHGDNAKKYATQVVEDLMKIAGIKPKVFAPEVKVTGNEQP